MKINMPPVAASHAIGPSCSSGASGGKKRCHVTVFQDLLLPSFSASHRFSDTHSFFLSQSPKDDKPIRHRSFLSLCFQMPTQITQQGISSAVSKHRHPRLQSSSQDFVILFPLCIDIQRLEVRPSNKTQLDLCGLEIRICCSFQTSWDVESCFVFGHPGHNGVYTCRMILEHCHLAG